MPERDPNKYDQIMVRLSEHPGANGEPQYWQVMLPHYPTKLFRNLATSQILGEAEEEYQFISVAILLSHRQHQKQPHTIPALLYWLEQVEEEFGNTLTDLGRKRFDEVRPHLYTFIRALKGLGFETPAAYKTGYE